jgi:hypothetical protein
MFIKYSFCIIHVVYDYIHMRMCVKKTQIYLDLSRSLKSI